jgi:hypothetical protein
MSKGSVILGRRLLLKDEFRHAVTSQLLLQDLQMGFVMAST